MQIYFYIISKVSHGNCRFSYTETDILVFGILDYN